MAVKKSPGLPPAVWNFNRTVVNCACSHRDKNCSTDSELAGDQMADMGGRAPFKASPNMLKAEAFARTTKPRASTNNAGHAAPSKPKTISELTQTSAYLLFGKFQDMVAPTAIKTDKLILLKSIGFQSVPGMNLLPKGLARTMDAVGRRNGGVV
jgi:hypothetical protein